LLAQKAATGGAAAKAAMGLLGVPVGPPRLPQAALTKEQLSALERDLNQINFFSWIA
jgi:N-acetylneuraminate lyase